MLNTNGSFLDQNAPIMNKDDFLSKMQMQKEHQYSKERSTRGSSGVVQNLMHVVPGTNGMLTGFDVNSPKYQAGKEILQEIQN